LPSPSDRSAERTNCRIGADGKADDAAIGHGKKSIRALELPTEGKRVMVHIKEEEVDLSDYRNFADARNQIGLFIEDVYNHKRINSSLGYLTPAEFVVALPVSKPEAGTP